MKRHYIQSICTFSIALPVLATVMLIGIICVIKSSVLADFSEEKLFFKTEQTQITELNELKAGHKKKLAQLNQWNQLLVSSDSYTKLNTQLRNAISNNNKTKTLQRIDQKKATSPSYAVDAPRSACEFTIEGTFTELQKCTTELECSMPNLMVNTMSIEPQTKSNLLKLKLNYTIWEKAQ